jgi:flagellar protein FliO/FliZ
MARTSGPRRLGVIESLVLDPQHRLVLVRFDQEERLLLLGEGRVLDRASTPPSQSL